MKPTQGVSVRQLKAARALLAWTQTDLATHSGVSDATIKRVEAKDGDIGGRLETAEKIIATLEAAGVKFLRETGGGQGVRLQKP
ncbi:MAG: helix-turn-helix domain-containing protein [Proteobacteria bacterium]|nr:helix-turn-helix domain-containing protein [Pseudomonadota bacterium]